MELIAFLRVLRRRRLAVAIGAVLAVVAGVTVGHSPMPSSALAKTRVMIDTPQSQLTATDPRGAGTLSWRATLLGLLLGTDQGRQEIARAANVPASEIGISDPELAAPATLAPLPTAAVQAAGTAQRYQLTVHTDDVLPIVSIAAAAPDRVGATRLAQGAVSALQVGASPKNTNVLQGLSIQQVSPIVTRNIPGGPGRKKMVTIAAVVFVLWCLCVTLGPALVRARRAPAAPEASGW